MSPKGDFYMGKKYMHGFALLMLVNLTSGVMPGNFESAIAERNEVNIVGTTVVNKNTPMKVKHRVVVDITAYSSTEDQTDKTPWVTASGALVEDGVIAANFLPFGARVQIPKLFGDKIFTVKDRMARRFNNRIDIWFPYREDAKDFGIQKAEIVIL